MILNIHGFRSCGDNAKAAFLRDLFPEVQIVSPTLPLAPHKALEVLEREIERCGKPLEMIVGSSLGGFYAYVLCCRYRVPAVLLNPAVVPFVHLAEAVGPVENACTGEPGTWTAEDCLALKDLFCETAYRAEGTLVHVFLTADDEVLEPRLTRAFFRFHGRLVELPWGTHRFEGLDRLSAEIRSIYDKAAGKTIRQDELGG
jgi:predicted esterase YcpF (UPF0227 family)